MSSNVKRHFSTVELRASSAPRESALLGVTGCFFTANSAGKKQKKIRKKNRKNQEKWEHYRHSQPHVHVSRSLIHLSLQNGCSSVETGSLPLRLEPLFSTETETDSPLQLKPVSIRHFLEQPSPSSRFPSSQSSELQPEHPSVTPLL